MSRAVEKIERRIEAIDRELVGYAPLAAERDRLVKMKAAILGEPVIARSLLRPRVAREDVASYLEANPGARAGQVAHALGVGQPAISAHLYRGRDRLFVNRGGRWFVGEPASGGRSARAA
jgi:hypothetical protein